MPETNFERVVLVLGLCVVGVLAFLVVGRDHRVARSPARTTVASTPAATTLEPTATSTEPALRPQLAYLVLAATRGDCWVVVRAGSAGGKVVFAGTISRGTAKRFTGARLWFRLGAAGNLTGRLDGVRIAIPPGSPTMIATAAGIRVLLR